MYKISGAKLLTFDFRDYALLTKAFLTDSLVLKGTTFADIVGAINGSSKAGMVMDEVDKDQWTRYVKDTSIRDLGITKDEKGAGGTIKDGETGEEIHVRKLGKIPSDFKKSAVSISPKKEGDRGFIYISSSKITSASFEIGEKKNVNFVFNKAIVDNHFNKEKFDKVAKAAIARVKENKSKVVFKIGEKASSKFIAVDHKTHGILVGFFLRDPVKKKDTLVTFGAGKPGSNVENHKHVEIPGLKKTDVGFLANVFKNMLFIAGKEAKKGLKGSEKQHALYPHLDAIAKAIDRDSSFARVATEAGRGKR